MQKHRLLLVENSRESAIALASYFERGGFSVETERDGVSGVQRFRAEEFDVVLVNSMLPKKDGLAVACEVRTAPRGSKAGIVMLSQFKAPELRSQAEKRAQIDGFFEHPFELRELRSELLRIADQYTGRVSAPPSSPGLQAAAKRQEGDREMGQGRSSSSSFPIPAREMGATVPKQVIHQHFDLTQAITLDETCSTTSLLLQLARERATGTVKLEQGESFLEVAFKNGVPVGAADNLRVNRLGERLHRAGHLDKKDMVRLNAHLATSKDRVAEALLSLEMCDEDTLCQEMVAQAKERLCRATGWEGGQARFVEDLDRIHHLAVTSLNIFEAILAWFTRRPDILAVGAWARDNRDIPLQKGTDFDVALMAYAQVRPQSPLAMLLMPESPKTITSVLKELEGIEKGGAAKWVADLYALTVSSALILGARNDADANIRVSLGASEKLGADKQAVKKIRALWLRVQGRDFYELVSVEPDAPLAEVQSALKAVQREYGRKAFSLSRLGPVENIAQALWAMLEDAERTFGNAQERRVYDTSLEPEIVSEAAVEKSDDGAKGEAELLRGRRLLEEGDVGGAREAFEAAVSFCPGVPEYEAFLGWALFLSGASGRPQGLALVRKTHLAHPDAMRPLFILGLMSLRSGQQEIARKLLTAAARLTPDDIEVSIALESLGSKST